MFKAPSRSGRRGSVDAAPTGAPSDAARTRFNISDDQARAASGCAKERVVRTSTTRRPRASNPGSMDRRRVKLWTSHPAPATTAIASAISSTIMADMMRDVPRLAVALRPLSFSSVLISARARRHAGANPS